VGVATIIDDDSASGTALSIGDVSVVEGAAGKRVLKAVVSLNEPLAEDIAFNFGIASTTATCAVFYGATPPAGADCKGQRKFLRVKMRAGTTSKPVSMTIYPDSTLEFDETLRLSLGDAGPTNESSPTVVGYLRANGTATLVDDD
ncbi:MAG TPA: hypothetical protein VNC41_18410, partial [Acidimicrobiia bacterium]|nr:hypothetical protein [Acidimicrobiia bacterium]